MHYSVELSDVLSKYNLKCFEVYDDRVLVEFEDCNEFTDFEVVRNLGYEVKFGEGDWINFVVV